MDTILFQIPIIGSEQYSDVVVLGGKSLDIAIQKKSGELWFNLGGYDDLSYPQSERDLSTMSRIAKVFSESIVSYIDVLPSVSGILLKEAIQIIRIDNYRL
ncbi:hypothetical protein XF24_00832 [candidate division SR1 bacterium Aalborg_AAW-1]|nr:hypothetical protein XF24_00832 [candidate division SR1 bacterium Aalborg_AAW-1]